MKKLIQLLLLIPILITLIEPVRLNAAAAQASGALLATGSGTTLYLPLVNKDHDIWPAVVILNGYDPDVPIQVPTINWLPISGAQFYQVRMVNLESHETFEETITTNFYEIWKEGHLRVTVRAGEPGYWAPWSKPMVVTSYTGSIFDGESPAILEPTPAQEVPTAFPRFYWSPVVHTHPGWDYLDDTFEIQMDDDADYSSPIMNKIVPARIGWAQLDKTYRTVELSGNDAVNVVNILLQPGITYYWRVRQIFRDTYYSNWSSETFTTTTFNDCRHIPSGKTGFQVSVSPTPGWPAFGDGWIDPYDPAIGAQQTFRIAVGVTPPQGNPIQSVTITPILDSGQLVGYPAVLVSGSALTSGYWEATYTVSESYCYNYLISVVAVNALGQKVVTLTLR